MKKILAFIYTLILITLLSYQIFATRWYVDKDATSTHNGTSWANAWLDVDDIAWSSLNPGDTVFVSGGTYTGQLAPLGTKSGTATNYIVVISAEYAYGISGMTGHTDHVIIEGGFLLNESGSAASDYVKIRGFEFTVNGVSLDIDYPAFSKGIILEKLYVHDYGATFGIRVISNLDSLIIDSCTVIDCLSLLSDCSGQRDCIHINWYTNSKPSNVIIRNNWMQMRSQDPTAHNDVIQSVGCDGLTIYNNMLISDSVNSPEGGGMPMIISSNDWDNNNTPPVLVFNNFAYMGGVWYPGANYGKTLNTRHDGGGTSDIQSPAYIFGNTLVSNGPRNSNVEQEYHIDFFSNNILASFCLPDGTFGENWRTGGTHGWHTNLSANDAYGTHLYRDSTRSNLFWREDNDQNHFAGSFYSTAPTTFSPSNWSTWVSNGGTGLNDNPDFVMNFGHVSDQSTVVPDIQATSPAINNGEDLTYLANYLAATYDLPDDIKNAMLRDINGNLRSDWDIGAFEYQSGTPAPQTKKVRVIIIQ